MDELQAAHERGEVRLDDFALALLTIGLAPRPGQSALLKVSDLSISAGPGGEDLFAITMPVIKVIRSHEPPAREKPQRLHHRLGGLLALQCAAARCWAAAKNMVADDAPMFPYHWQSAKYSDLPWTVGHASGPALSARLTGMFERLDLSSMRADEAERGITATRIRRSLASIARGKGRSHAQVGRLLGHHGPWAAHVYCTPGVEVIRAVERAIDFRPVAELYLRELETARQEGRRPYDR